MIASDFNHVSLLTLSSAGTLAVVLGAIAVGMLLTWVTRRRDS